MINMSITNAIKSVVRFYADGFRQMSWGRTLWLLILLKLFIMFGILKLFFFPDFLSTKAGGNEVNYVSNQLIEQSMAKDTTLQR